jgi:hypothetical protein
MRSAIPQARSPSAVESVDASPRAGEVTSEIGLMLAIHLAVALAVGVTLTACGIG